MSKLNQFLINSIGTIENIYETNKCYGVILKQTSLPSKTILDFCERSENVVMCTYYNDRFYFSDTYRNDLIHPKEMIDENIVMNYFSIFKIKYLLKLSLENHVDFEVRTISGREVFTLRSGGFILFDGLKCPPLCPNSFYKSELHSTISIDEISKQKIVELS